jgi:hypothetical protein
MHELLSALNGLPATQWRNSALSVLQDENAVFEGRSDAKETSTAQGFADLYQMRMEGAGEKAVDMIGIHELLVALRKRPPGTRVHGEPYLGTSNTVFAFWEEDRAPIGCLTLPNTNSEEASYLFAIGKSA